MGALRKLQQARTLAERAARECSLRSIPWQVRSTILGQSPFNSCVRVFLFRSSRSFILPLRPFLRPNKRAPHLSHIGQTIRL